MTHDGGQQGAQRELYGQTWAERLARLRDAYRLSQGGLAAVVGLSAPMVSQLVGGHRVKISNPVVYARIVSLEAHLTDAGVVAGDESRIRALLDEVAASSPHLTTTTSETPHGADAGAPSGGSRRGHEQAMAWLAALGSAPALESTSAHARALGAGDLATALAEAAARSRAQDVPGPPDAHRSAC